MKIAQLDEQVAMKAFKDFEKVGFQLIGLRSLVQNPMPITSEEMLDFENKKNEIINAINSISMDIKINYESKL